MRKIFYLTFSLLILGVLSQDQKNCDEEKEPGENKTKCNVTKVTNNATNSCCLVKTKNATKNYCHELPWNITEIQEYQKEMEKTYTGETLQVLCNAKFLSIGFIFALLLFLL